MKNSYVYLKVFAVLVLTFTIAAIFSIGGLLSEAEANPAVDKPKYGGTFVVAAGRDPITLNTATTGAFFDKLVGAILFDTLVQLDFDLKPVPRLASSWEISPDGLTYTFHLVKTKWHDGHPFSSEDVKFTIEQLVKVYNPRGTQYEERIQEILTPDPQTVIFKLRKTFEPFLIMLAFDGYVQPKHLYEGTDIPKNPARLKPIGTGPFKFEEWKKGDYIRVVRNNDYFMKGQPYLDQILFKVAADPGARIMAFEKGEIDYLSFYYFSASEVERIKKIPGFKVSTKGHEIFSDILPLTINLDKAPLNNLKVRQAIAHAIDKQYILDKADYGLGKIATGPIPAALRWAYTSDVIKYNYDVAKANKLLDEAGYPKDAKGLRFNVSIIYDRTVPLFTKTAEILREMLRSVGIDLVLKPSDRATAGDMVYVKRDFDFFLQGMSTGGDPAIGVQRLYIGSNIGPAIYSNGSAYRNAKVDDLFIKAATAVDRKDRAKFYYEIQRIITQDLPTICLLEYSLNSAWRDEFRGVHAWSGQSFYNLGDIWWTKGREKP